MVDKMTEKEKIEGRYLGDGVYASYDGYQIWLSVQHPINKVVSLDKEVMQNLKQYEKELGDKK